MMYGCWVERGSTLYTVRQAFSLLCLTFIRQFSTSFFFPACRLGRHFSDKNMKHLPRLLTMCPCLACRIPLLESTVNENTCTAESAKKLSIKR